LSKPFALRSDKCRPSDGGLPSWPPGPSWVDQHQQRLIRTVISRRSVWMLTDTTSQPHGCRSQPNCSTASLCNTQQHRCKTKKAQQRTGPWSPSHHHCGRLSGTDLGDRWDKLHLFAFQTSIDQGQKVVNSRQ
jgi:hypothetical protein